MTRKAPLGEGQEPVRVMTPYMRALNVAIGYCELGMWLEANEAIEDMDPEWKTETPTLAVRRDIFRALGATDLENVMKKELARRLENEAEQA